jgi:hypothetical protein
MIRSDVGYEPGMTPSRHLSVLSPHRIANAASRCADAREEGFGFNESYPGRLHRHGRNASLT